MADLDLDDRLLAALKRHCPAKVRALDAADEARIIAVPSGSRKRWTKVMIAIDARPWVRLEFLDKSGDILGYHDNDRPAGELEDLAVAGDGKVAASVVARQADLKMMLEAQKVALSYQREETREMLAGVAELLRANVEGVKQLVQLYQVQVQVAAEVAALRATAEAGDDLDKWVKMMEAAPDAVAKFAPMLRLMMGSGRTQGKPSSPANGAKPSSPANGAPK